MTDFELTTTAGDAVRNKYRNEGRSAERDYIMGLIKNQVCFDALANADGRCSFHGGKCFELLSLLHEMKMGRK